MAILCWFPFGQWNLSGETGHGMQPLQMNMIILGGVMAVKQIIFGRILNNVTILPITKLLNRLNFNILTTRVTKGAQKAQGERKI